MKKVEMELFNKLPQNGLRPIVGYFKDWYEQAYYIDDQLIWLRNNDNLHSTTILHWNQAGIIDMKTFLEANCHSVSELKDIETLDIEDDSIKLGTISNSAMSRMEFTNVFIIDINDDVFPYHHLPNDEISQEERLLYSVMTRAKERLYLLSSGNPSKYLTEIDHDLIDQIGSPEEPVTMTIGDFPF